MPKLNLGTVRHWCSENNVFISKQGKNEFVFESNFNEVYELPFINKLKSKFGNDWEAAYRLYKDGNIVGLNTLQNITNESPKVYKPKNNIINDYLTKFRNHGNDKKAA